VGSPGTIQAIPNATESGAPAAISLQNDGVRAASGLANGSWVLPATAAIAAHWQVRVDVTAGSIDSGTTGSYLDLSTTRAWQKNSAGVATLTFTFREKISGQVRSTQAGVTITVT